MQFFPRKAFTLSRTPAHAARRWKTIGVCVYRGGKASIVDTLHPALNAFLAFWGLSGRDGGGTDSEVFADATFALAVGAAVEGTGFAEGEFAV